MELFFTMLVPLIIAAVALYGMARRVDVYDALVQGAGEGLGVLLRIVPPLVGLLTAVYMLRASGALELAARALAPVLTALGIPPETVALLLVRPVSGSAALGVGAELIATYGPDSLIGRTAAVMLGSTETTFYTIAVYFGAAGIVKTRYAVPAALCADLAGFMAAAWAVRVIPLAGAGHAQTQIARKAAPACTPGGGGFCSKGEILVLQPAEVGCHRRRRHPLEGVVLEGAAAPAGGDYTLFGTEDFLLVQWGAPLTVGAPGLDILLKQHGAPSLSHNISL